MQLGKYAYSHKNSNKKRKRYCFISFRHCHKQVLLLTCLDTLAKVTGDIEPVGKFEIGIDGWGEVAVFAELLATQKGYTVFKKDQFYLSGDYPNYEDIEF